MIYVAARSRPLGTCVEFFRRRASRIVVCCLVVHLLLSPSALPGVTHPLPSLGMRRAIICLQQHPNVSPFGYLCHYP